MINLVNSVNFSSVLKLGFLALDIMFMLFILVVIRQVLSMNTIVHDINDSTIIKLGAIILFIFALSLFFVSLVIL